MYICKCIQYVYLSDCSYVCPSVHVLNALSICLSICLFYPSIYPLIYLSVYVSFCFVLSFCLLYFLVSFFLSLSFLSLCFYMWVCICIHIEQHVDAAPRKSSMCQWSRFHIRVALGMLTDSPRFLSCQSFLNQLWDTVVFCLRI